MEENKSRGYIKTYRSVFKHWIWQDKDPFDRRSAWIDLLGLVNFEAGKKLSNGQLINLQPGQTIASLRFLAERWKWSTTKVERYIKCLQDDNMIVLESLHKNTLLTICNYSVYNEDEVSEVTQEIHKKDTEVTQEIRKSNTEVTKPLQREEFKKDNNLRIQEEEITPGENINRDYMFLVNWCIAAPVVGNLEKPISQKEYVAMRENYTHEQIMECLEIMENSKSTKKKTSAYLTCLNFLKTNFGSSEVQQCYEEFEKQYKEFSFERTGANPKIDKFEKRALRSIILFLLENNPIAIAKTKALNKQDVVLTDVEGAKSRWAGILTNWSKLDNFMQARIKLQEIDKDIIKILGCLQKTYTHENKHDNKHDNAKGGFGKDGNTDTSKPKQYD